MMRSFLFFVLASSVLAGFCDDPESDECYGNKEPFHPKKEAYKKNWLGCFYGLKGFPNQYLGPLADLNAQDAAKQCNARGCRFVSKPTKESKDAGYTQRGCFKTGAEFKKFADKAKPKDKDVKGFAEKVAEKAAEAAEAVNSHASKLPGTLSRILRVSPRVQRPLVPDQPEGLAEKAKKANEAAKEAVARANASREAMKQQQQKDEEAFAQLDCGKDCFAQIGPKKRVDGAPCDKEEDASETLKEFCETRCHTQATVKGNNNKCVAGPPKQD